MYQQTVHQSFVLLMSQSTDYLYKIIESDFTGAKVMIQYLIIERPADVFQVSVVEEHVGIFLHPHANLLHADGAYLRLGVSVTHDVL